MQEKLCAWVDAHTDDVVALLQDLVSIPSVTGDEGPIQVFIADRLRAMGLAVDVFEPDHAALKRHPAYVEVSQGYEGRPNVVATLRGAGGGRSLLFNGHVDVIPVGPPGPWAHPPFGAEIENGRLYGRGASDMKAGLAAMTMAVAAVQGCGVRLKGDVILEYTVDEELSGNGTLDCVMKGYRADAGICCETSSMRVQPGSIGRIWWEIRVRGKAAGIQRRWEGVNAIEKAYRVVQAVAEYEKIRVGRLSHPLYPDVRGAIPCMVGVFEAGTYHSAFPDAAVLKGSMATLPGEDSQAVKEDFARFVKKAVSDDPWLAGIPPEVVFTGYFAEPAEIPVESPIVATLSGSFRGVTGKEPVITGREGAADIRHLNRYGDTPTVIFGPGATEQMHAGNEWASIPDLIEAAKVLAATIVAWCGVK